MEIDGRGSFPRNTLGAATINIVLDHLSDFEIVSTPENPNRTASWCSAPLPPNKQTPYDDRVTLYVIEAGDAEELFAQHSNAIGLIALQQDEPFSSEAPPFPAGFLRHLIVIRSKAPIGKTKLLGTVMSTVYSCLFAIREWTGNLANIVSRKGTIQELIDESEQMFDNFIDANDSTYSLIARTKNIEPADPLSTELVRLGCHNLDAVKAAESIGAFGEWRDQSGINVFGPDETVPFEYITYVLKDGSSYAGHIVMVCNNHKATPGMVDMFRILSNACQQIVSSEFFNETPAALFLRKLIDDTRLTQAYFDEQSSLLNLDTAGWFGLGMVDYREGEYAEQPSWVTSMLQKAYPNYQVFSYEESLLVLSFCKEGHIERRKEDLEKLDAFCREMECVAYASDTFEHLRNLRFALMQTRIARSYKSCIDIEMRPLDNIDSRRVFHFGDAFAYHCLDGHGVDSDLWSFCMDHTILDDIVAAEPGHSVSDVKLLYCYLFNERKTTPTAQQLHMHRNNVLYRIGSIEKRFGIDLGQFGTRERLISCYRYKILTSNKFRQLLV